MNIIFYQMKYFCRAARKNEKAKKNKPQLTPPPPGVLLPTSGLWPQFLGRALAALRSIGMTNRHVGRHIARLSSRLLLKDYNCNNAVIKDSSMQCISGLKYNKTHKKKITNTSLVSSPPFSLRSSTHVRPAATLSW
jgi:hypothetical protein